MTKSREQFAEARECLLAAEMPVLHSLLRDEPLPYYCQTGASKNGDPVSEVLVAKIIVLICGHILTRVIPACQPLVFTPIDAGENFVCGMVKASSTKAALGLYRDLLCTYIYIYMYMYMYMYMYECIYIRS